MSQSDCVDACKDLLIQLSSITHANSRSSESFEAVVASLNQVVSSSGSEIKLSGALSILTHYVVKACHSSIDDAHSIAMLAILADATRKFPVWRSLFGQDRHHEDGMSTCILDVAQEVVGQSSQNQIDQLQSALRLIANCCADNNRNRKHFLSHGGLEALIRHLLTPSNNSDLLIPTIYNVCYDYEDPDIEEARSSTILEQAHEDQRHIESVSFAAKKLASTCVGRTDLTTFELLLAPSIRPSSERLGFLAGLVELAALPATEGISCIIDDRASIWQWSFTYCGQDIQTLEAANELANDSTECRVSVLRAILYVLSQDAARQALLRRHDDSILQLIRLAVFSPESGDLDDYEQEISACCKEFIKTFYTITGMSEFSENKEATMRMVESCLNTLSAKAQLPGDGQNVSSHTIEDSKEDSDMEYGNEATQRNTHSAADESPIMKSCILVILAQLSVQNQLREKLLASKSFLSTISSILNTDSTVEMVYPAITLVTSLSLKPQAVHVLLTDSMLRGMKRLMTVGGLGLAIPYETIHAFRWLCRGNLECLVPYTHNSKGGSVITCITKLFDRTIEAGTKLEVGLFFIELLRTIFPSFAKEDLLETTLKDTGMLTAFNDLLNVNGYKIAEALTFVCTQAEPQTERVHGWFGLGMLSVWSRGRLAVANAIEHHGLDQGISELVSAQDGPAYRNMVLMLTKMQLCTKQELSNNTIECLREAIRIVNVNMASA